MAVKPRENQVQHEHRQLETAGPDAADGLLTADQLRTYDEKGFITIEDVLSADEVSTYRTELFRLGDELRLQPRRRSSQRVWARCRSRRALFE